MSIILSASRLRYQRLGCAVRRPRVCPTAGLAFGIAIGFGLLAPSVVQGQTAKKVGQTLWKILTTPRPDTAVGHTTVSANGDITATGRPGGAIRYVETPRIEGVDSVSAIFVRDTTPTLTKASVPCGLRRLCAAGFDLQVVALTTPGMEVPGGQPIYSTVVITNRGRIASPASEVAWCRNDAYSESGCGSSVGIGALPPLAPGDTLRLTKAIPTADEQGGRVAVWIDPDDATGETKRENNGATVLYRLARPELKVLAIETPQGMRSGRPLPLLLRIRNASLTAASPATTLTVSSDRSECAMQQLHDPRYSLPVPALGPRQTYVVSLLVRDATFCPGWHSETHNQLPAGTAVRLMISFDNANPSQWGPNHESMADRRLVVTP